MRRKRAFVFAALALALLAPAAQAQRAGRGAGHTVKIATLAPEGSAWMLAFERMSDEILAATDGQLRMKAYPAGVLGEEKDVLFKIKVGQVDGGGFMGFGVSRICPDAEAIMQLLQFRDYAEVDAVFEAIRPHLDAQCRENGYVALGWTEIGFSYVYSTQPVRSLDDLRGAKPWLLPGSDTVAELFRRGGVSGIPVPVGDVLTALQTGLIKTVFGPPLATVATQWFTRVKYRTDVQLVYSLGGLFVAEARWNEIPEELRHRAADIARRAMSELSAEVRRSNAEALEVMAREGVELVATTAEGMREFAEVSREVTRNNVGKQFSAAADAIVSARLAELRGESGAAPGPAKGGE